MTATKRPDAPRVPETGLETLRSEIDGIDRAIHTLLIERSEIIDRLIAVKARQGGGSAFRPAREAEMMRRLVTRHRGILPLDTVEGIWRIIISTFTYVQAPYAVHADISAGDARMRDACRFHFGFTVPMTPHRGAHHVIAAVAAAEGDLGLVRVEDAASVWWEELMAPDAPKIIARLPFVERADHAAGLPLYVVAKPISDAAVNDVLLHAVRLPGATALPPLAGVAELVAKADKAAGLSFVVAAPEAVGADGITRACRAAGHADAEIAFIGSHAARFEVDTAARLAAQ